MCDRLSLHYKINDYKTLTALLHPRGGDCLSQDLPRSKQTKPLDSPKVETAESSGLKVGHTVTKRWAADDPSNVYHF